MTEQLKGFEGLRETRVIATGPTAPEPPAPPKLPDDQPQVARDSGTPIS
jgi:hypothetical protein